MAQIHFMAWELYRCQLATLCPSTPAFRWCSDPPITEVYYIVHNRGIPLLSYDVPQKSVLSVLSFKSHQLLQHLYDKPVSELSCDENTLWHAGWFVNDPENPRVPWSGFMHDLYKCSSNSPGQPVRSAVITMHPIIDENPNDLSTIYSTLMFVDQQAKRFDLFFPQHVLHSTSHCGLRQ